jgi:hypothetical protein
VDGLTLLAQTAERALCVSGGKLELSKCFWYLIQWLWDSRNRPYMASSNKCSGRISMTQGISTTTPITITRLEPSESHRTLGVYLNPLGSHETQMVELIKRTRSFSSAATHRSLNIPNKALKSLQTNLMKTLKRKMKFRSNISDSIMLRPRIWCGISLR